MWKWTCWFLICAGFTQLACGTSWAQTKRALLIGIDTYQPADTVAHPPQGCTYGRCDLTSFENLEGPLNDVAAMRDLLTSPKFGFPVDNVIAITNPLLPGSQIPYVNLGPSETTHDGLLRSMRKYLVEEPRRGDTVLFYYAGHGSLRVNSKGTKLTLVVGNSVTHADSTIVPSDAWNGAYDVRDREMTRIFNEALNKGVRLTVILDSCHSGGITRGLKLKGRSARKRWVPYDPRDINEGPDMLPDGQLSPAPADRTDNAALIFSAAQQDQSAQESPPPDNILKPHGAFTVALIKALQVLPASAPASVVYMRVTADMEGSGIDDQTPSLDAGPSRRDEPLFGGAPEGAKKVRAAIVATDPDGNVVLDTGKLAGIGPNSEFVSLAADRGGHKIRLKVTDFDGIARSKAIVVSPKGARVAHGDVFELRKWVPASSDPLRFWTWPSNLSETELRMAAEQIKASGIASVEDPVEQEWTDMLLWDGTTWILQHAGGDTSTPVGSNLTAEILKRNLGPNAKLWVNFPPSRELSGAIKLNAPDSAVEGVADISNASYILVGALNRNALSWAWLHKGQFLTGPRKKTTNSHTAGCSETSRYPARTDWVRISVSNTAADAAETLNTYASRLAKLHGWLNLAASPTGASTENYYGLAFVRIADQKILSDGQPVQRDDLLKMVLTSSVDVAQRRWVYVLDIDCQGRGTLLYPIEFSGNRFPNNASEGPQIDLKGAKIIQVGSPYGIETIILLSTSQPLPDPPALNFEGVSARQVNPVQSPLQRLLSTTSSGKRSLETEMPTDWGISIGTLQSVPKGNR